MKLSTKGIYAIEAMVDLALHSENNVVSMKHIASRRDISEKYLEQIIGSLRRAKLIESVRGANGGYRLVKDPSEITIYEIIRAVETKLHPVQCLENGCGENNRVENCVAYGVWSNLWAYIERTCTETTIADIIVESRKMTLQEDIEYYI